MQMKTIICSSKIVNLVGDSRFYSFKSVSNNLQEVLRTMPKEVKHTAALQKQRQKLKEKNQKYIPGKVTLKILGSGAKGAPRSLYVFTDQSRYLFNCGEGTQRLAHEHRMKLSKLEHIFITHRSWENIGGLPGIALTIQDVGVPEITVHGPVGTDEIFKATRRFVILRDLSVKMADCCPSNYFQDNVMKVFYVPIDPVTARADVKNGSSDGENLKHSVRNESQEEDEIDYYAHERKNRISHIVERGPRKQQRTDVNNTPSAKPSSAAMCYICRLQPRPGALSLERCVERGVPPGPLLGKLKSGEDIVLKDGTVVYSADVRQPDDPGPIFIVVECPTIEYIENLVNDPMILRHQSSAEKEEDLAALVVHFSPQNVLDDCRYKSWMEKFSISTQHLLLNDDNRCMGSVAVHRIQYKLNLLHPNLFPLLGDKSIKIDENQTLNHAIDKTELINGEKDLDSSITANDCVSSFRGKTLDSVHLRPRKMWDRLEELTLTPKLFIDETCGSEEFSEALSELKQKIKEIEQNIVTRDFDPQISFLGTGSCIPNKTRNTSGILLHISESESILLDCGEGTYGQIVRLFGPEKADHVLLGIKSIFVSHLHADHHLGLIGLLKARRRALEKHQNMSKPIFLIAPQQIMSWLSLYHWNFEPVTQEILLVPNAHLDLNHPVINEEVKKRVLETLNMEAINTVYVKHCPNAFGISFKHKDNWKITYSGDTMPCSQLVDLGQDSDVLIHEATMEDELVDEARIKLHSTTSQAIEMGKKMNAKFILLTHFSQRYAKIPRINDNFSHNVGIAFDNMQVCFSQLPLLPLLHPTLKIMFAEHYDEMEQKTFRRLMKLEREKEAQNVEKQAI